MPGGKIDVVGNVKAEVLADLDRGLERINFFSVVRGSAWPRQRPLQALQIYPEPGFYPSLNGPPRSRQAQARDVQRALHGQEALDAAATRSVPARWPLAEKMTFLTCSDLF